jgi:hypothetical protein
MACCPFCQRGALRIIATITQGEVISQILRHLKRAADPPPIAPARSRQETFDWVASTHGVARGLISDVRAVEVCLPPLSVEIPFASSRPSTHDGPTPLPSCAACPDRTAPRDVMLWVAGGAPAEAVPKGRLNFLSAHRRPGMRRPGSSGR